jgi:hypothetical protein
MAQPRFHWSSLNNSQVGRFENTASNIHLLFCAYSLLQKTSLTSCCIAMDASEKLLRFQFSDFRCHVTILKWTSKKWDERAWIRFIWFRIMAISEIQ